MSAINFDHENEIDQSEINSSNAQAPDLDPEESDTFSHLGP
jgi:hypothetical protein